MLIALYTVSIATFVWFRLSMNKGDQANWTQFKGMEKSQ